MSVVLGYGGGLHLVDKSQLCTIIKGCGKPSIDDGKKFIKNRLGHLRKHNGFIHRQAIQLSLARLSGTKHFFEGVRNT
jgi:hypothetical protein